MATTPESQYNTKKISMYGYSKTSCRFLGCLYTPEISPLSGLARSPSREGGKQSQKGDTDRETKQERQSNKTEVDKKMSTRISPLRSQFASDVHSFKVKLFNEACVCLFGLSI